MVRPPPHLPGRQRTTPGDDAHLRASGGSRTPARLMWDRAKVLQKNCCRLGGTSRVFLRGGGSRAPSALYIWGQSGTPQTNQLGQNPTKPLDIQQNLDHPTQYPTTQ